MPATEAQIAANRRNAALSTGPKTEEGKERSRANSYKHGLTGLGKVLPELEAAEVQRRTEAFAGELRPTSEVGVALVRMAATLSVRVERCVEQENIAQTVRVRQVMLDFVPPEGADEAEAAQLRSEAARLALFDPSKEACLARKYEAAARQGFFRALKELRQVEKQIRGPRMVEVKEDPEEEIEPELESEPDELGSILEDGLSDLEFEAMCAEAGLSPPPLPGVRSVSAVRETFQARVDVPIAAGRGR